jgi:hypothetical protein
MLTRHSVESFAATPPAIARAAINETIPQLDLSLLMALEWH